MKKQTWDAFLWPSIILAPALTWFVLQLVWGSRPLNAPIMYWVCGADLVVAIAFSIYSRSQLTRQQRRDKER